MDQSFGSTERREMNSMQQRQQQQQQQYQQNYPQHAQHPSRRASPTAAAPISHPPKRTMFWPTKKEQKDPNGHKVSSKSPSNLIDRKADPPEGRQVSSGSPGFMTREGDLLDRTFDNVENVTCSRTSASRAPPAPVFACTTDFAVLSNAKRQSYSIEQCVGDENHDSTNNQSPPSATASEGVFQTAAPIERGEVEATYGPLVVPVNSILEEPKQVVGEDASGSTRAEKAVASKEEKKQDMLDYFFEGVQSMICREDRSPAIKPEDSMQVEIPLQKEYEQQQQQQQLQQRQRQELQQKSQLRPPVERPPRLNIVDATIDGNNSSDDPSPLNLHPVVSGSDANGMANACDNLFTKGRCVGNNEDAPSTSAASPHPAHGPASEAARSTMPRTGMMLLPDGSVVVPGERSDHWTPANRNHSLYAMKGAQHLSSRNMIQQHPPSVRRDSSLLDMASGSVNSSDKDPHRRSIRSQKRVRMTGGSQSVTIPHRLDYYSDEEAQMEAEDTLRAVERQHFWKQVALAGTILFVACGLIVFAMSFFWPVN